MMTRARAEQARAYAARCDGTQGGVGGSGAAAVGMEHVVRHVLGIGHAAQMMLGRQAATDASCDGDAAAGGWRLLTRRRVRARWRCDATHRPNSSDDGDEGGGATVAAVGAEAWMPRAGGDNGGGATVAAIGAEA